MSEQLDLFAGDGCRPAPEPPVAPPPGDPSELDDDALVAALARASSVDLIGLANEAARRRLAAAIPELEALCRRFKGFGLEKPLRKQQAALCALSEIGGQSAADAVARLVANSVVQGPGLVGAVRAAARLHSVVSRCVVLEWLCHPDPAIRAEACRCARRHPETEARLIELLDDLNPPVAPAAACALGRLGHREVRPILRFLLHEAPSAEVIEAIVPIADEDSAVQLGRLARSHPELRADVLAALEQIEHPRAAVIVAALQRDS